jgi:hypothetical protein
MELLGTLQPHRSRTGAELGFLADGNAEFSRAFRPPSLRGAAARQRRRSRPSMWWRMGV